MCIIAKIVIRGCSGYGPYDAAYEDKLTLTSSSIAYEYKPLCISVENPVRKWSYKTTSEEFAMLFSQIAELMPYILEPDVDSHCCDAGIVDFTVTYADKSKRQRTYWGAGDNFRKIFSLIKHLVPQTEQTPEVLMIDEDHE